MILQVGHTGKAQEVEEIIDPVESWFLFVHTAAETVGNAGEVIHQLKFLPA